ncbi:hypothetical protein FUSPEROL_00530 [Fusobacterium periodonticum ATCC 33693]|uniref:Uncharacterized protein n=1 Tax=Fusobacterium periodonticum ATCC 33693 TaxID=546275 RepID=D4CT18_9FUSO|nr:hypothetical protein FUSPEROL_00530 [Fusobacterium periodonticum ATCC 33693]
MYGYFLYNYSQITYLIYTKSQLYLLKITAGFLFIKDGEITESGTKEKIFSKPEKDYTKN